MRALAVAGLVLAAAGVRAAEPAYETVRDRLMCRTQQALRDGLKALETRDSFLMSTVSGCHFSVDGVPATVLQDNISRIKIRLSAAGEQAEMWTVPETILPARPRPEE